MIQNKDTMEKYWWKRRYFKQWMLWIRENKKNNEIYRENFYIYIYIYMFRRVYKSFKVKAYQKDINEKEEGVRIESVIEKKHLEYIRFEELTNK